jgi:hypothetical protein
MLYRFRIIVLVSFISAVLLSSCSEDAVSPMAVNETVLFEKQGLVDSAVVYGCYAYTVRYFVPDTFSFSGYSKIKVMFDGFANSEGSSISILYNTADSSNVQVYYVEDEPEINKIHTFEYTKPSMNAWFELRLYINPPICGTNEFKYTRARDLKIYGIK